MFRNPHEHHARSLHPGARTYHNVCATTACLPNPLTPLLRKDVHPTSKTQSTTCLFVLPPNTSKMHWQHSKTNTRWESQRPTNMIPESKTAQIQEGIAQSTRRVTPTCTSKTLIKVTKLCTKETANPQQILMKQNMRKRLQSQHTCNAISNRKCAKKHAA